MGTHPIFESDFDCLTDVAHTDHPVCRARHSRLCQSSTDLHSAEDGQLPMFADGDEAKKVHLHRVSSRQWWRRPDYSTESDENDESLRGDPLFNRAKRAANGNAGLPEICPGAIV